MCSLVINSKIQHFNIQSFFFNLYLRFFKLPLSSDLASFYIFQSCRLVVDSRLWYYVRVNHPLLRYILKSSSYVCQVPRRNWSNGMYRTRVLFSKVATNYTLKYHISKVQFNFLRLLSTGVSQWVSYVCKRSTAWYNEREDTYKYGVRFHGWNGKRFKHNGKFSPNVIRDGCQVWYRVFYFQFRCGTGLFGLLLRSFLAVMFFLIPSARLLYLPCTFLHHDIEFRQNYLQII